MDLLLDTQDGPVVVEVKNYRQKVGKEAVIKASTVADDIGVRGVIVVSASGFTDDAVKVAKALRVELLTLDDLLGQIELSTMPGDAVFLNVSVGRGEALRYASKQARRRILFLRDEKPSIEECVYHPIYYITARVTVGSGPRYMDVNIAVPSVYGLPLAYRGGRMELGLGRVAGMPHELLRAYRKIAGSVVSRSELVGRLGESGWRRLYNMLQAAGLVETASRKPLIVRILNDIPRVDELEAAADTMITQASRAPSRECRLEEPLISPGAVSSFLEAALDARISKYTFLYAPLYKVRLTARDGSYRIIWVTAWTPKPVRVLLPD